MTQGTDFRQLREEVLGEDDEGMPADLDLDVMEMATHQPSYASHAAANLASPALTSYCGLEFDPETTPAVPPSAAADLTIAVPNRSVRRNSLVNQNVPSIAQEYRRRRRSSMAGGPINMSASADQVPSSPSLRAAAGKGADLSPYLTHLPARGRSGASVAGSSPTWEQSATHESSFAAAVGKVQKAQKFAMLTGAPSMAQEYRRRRNSMHAPPLQGGSATPPPGMVDDGTSAADATSLAEAANMALAQMSSGANPKPQVNEMAQLCRRYRRNSMSRLGQDRSQWINAKTTSSKSGEGPLAGQEDINMHASAPPTPQNVAQRAMLKSTDEGRSLGVTLPDLEYKQQAEQDAEHPPLNPYTTGQRKGMARHSSTPSNLARVAKHTQSLHDPLIGDAAMILDESSGSRSELSHGNRGSPREIEDAGFIGATRQASNVQGDEDSRTVSTHGSAGRVAEDVEVVFDSPALVQMLADSPKQFVSRFSPDRVRKPDAEMHSVAVEDEVVDVASSYKFASSNGQLSRQEPVQNPSATWREGEDSRHSPLQLSFSIADNERVGVADALAPSSSSENPSDALTERETPTWYNAMSGEPVSDEPFRGNDHVGNALRVSELASRYDSKKVDATPELLISGMLGAQQSEDRLEKSQGPAQDQEMEDELPQDTSMSRSKITDMPTNRSTSYSKDIAMAHQDAHPGDSPGRQNMGLASEDPKELTRAVDLSGEASGAGSLTSLNHLSQAGKQGSSPGVSNPLLSSLMGKMLDTKVVRSPRTVSTYVGGVRQVHSQNMQIETQADPEKLDLDFMYNLASPADSLHLPLASGIDISQGMPAMNNPVANTGSSTGMVGTYSSTARSFAPDDELTTQQKWMPIEARSARDVPNFFLDGPTMGRDSDCVMDDNEMTEEARSQCADQRQPTENKDNSQENEQPLSATLLRTQQDSRRISCASSSGERDRQRRWSMEHDDTSGSIPINSRRSETRSALGTSNLPGKVELSDCLQEKLVSLNLSSATDLAQIQSLLVTFAAELIDIMTSEGIE